MLTFLGFDTKLDRTHCLLWSNACHRVVQLGAQLSDQPEEDVKIEDAVGTATSYDYSLYLVVKVEPLHGACHLLLSSKDELSNLLSDFALLFKAQDEVFGRYECRCGIIKARHGSLLLSFSLEVQAELLKHHKLLCRHHVVI